MTTDIQKFHVFLQPDIHPLAASLLRAFCHPVQALDGTDHLFLACSSVEFGSYLNVTAHYMGISKSLHIPHRLVLCILELSETEKNPLGFAPPTGQQAP